MITQAIMGNTLLFLHYLRTTGETSVIASEKNRRKILEEV